jgi:hypothetical protein
VNYTRGQLTDFKVRAYYGTPPNLIPCIGSTCIASYTISNATSITNSNSSMTWDSQGYWRDAPSTLNKNCNIVYDINATAVDRTTGVNATVAKKFYVDCTPKLVVLPAIARIPLGTVNSTVFTATIWNPDTAAKTFDLRMYEPKGAAASWLKWDNGITLLNDFNISNVVVAGGSSRSFPVNITYGGRAGTYEIHYTAQSGATYSADTVLSIYSESVSEFPSIWLIALAAIGVLALLFLI